MRIGTSRMAAAERISRTSVVFFSKALGDQSNKIRSGTLWAIASIEGYRSTANSNPKRLATTIGAVSASESVTTTATISLMASPLDNWQDYPIRFLCEANSLCEPFYRSSARDANPRREPRRVLSAHSYRVSDAGPLENARGNARVQALYDRRDQLRW